MIEFERLGRFDQTIKHHLLAAGVCEVSFHQHPINRTTVDVHVIPLTVRWSVLLERPREAIEMVMLGLDELLADVVDGYLDRGKLLVSHDHVNDCSYVYVAKLIPLDVLVGKRVTLNAGKYKDYDGIVRTMGDIYVVELTDKGPYVSVRVPADVTPYPPRNP